MTTRTRTRTRNYAYVRGYSNWEPGHSGTISTGLIWETPQGVWKYIDQNQHASKSEGVARECFEVELPRAFSLCTIALPRESPYALPRESPYQSLSAEAIVTRRVDRLPGSMIELNALREHMVSEARISSCFNDKRAAAMLSPDGELLSIAFNGPPGELDCSRTTSCRAACARACMHAEARAIVAAPAESRRGADLVHVRLDTGPESWGTQLKVAASREPRCLDCARFVIEYGIAAVWLHHADGWRRWPALEFFEATCRNVGVPPFDGSNAAAPEIIITSEQIEVRHAGDRVRMPRASFMPGMHLIPEAELVRLTENLAEHPGGWEWPCLCAECRASL